MFILGMHFPADMGNKIPDEKVVAKMEEAGTGSYKEIKLKMGKNRNELTELSYTNTDTFMFKALCHFFEIDNDAKEEKYFIYTNRYQISELSKRLDSDDETMALCKKFDSMDMFTIQAV